MRTALASWYNINTNLPVFVSNVGAAQSIAGGDDHSLAVKTDGTVWAWGSNFYGELGKGTIGGSSNVPVQVKDPKDPTGYLTGVQAIAAGGYHSLAIKSGGTAWAWGDNYKGQLGDGTTSIRNTPVQVMNLSGVQAIDAGDQHSLAVAGGTVWAWGANESGQLGDGTQGYSAYKTTPVKLNLSGVTGISGGFAHSLAVKSIGTVWAWGDDESGQLGDGTYYSARTTPVQVKSLSGVRGIAAGRLHSLAVKTDGTVWAWGHGYHGQLGNGAYDRSYLPVQVNNLPLSGIKDIAAGGYHSLATMQ